ncbi:AMP-binding protein [Acinetobacter sp. RW6]|uniref:AMP-binding protein n=1 Tax=Acinetobacter sp. RW6 TaxID=3242680 RepID=UPI0035C0943C
MLLDKLLEYSKNIPNDLAVVANDEILTYFELEQKSSILASNILQDKYINGESPKQLLIGIYGQRNIDSICLMFGILKANHAYTFIEEEGDIVENYNKIKLMNLDVVICNNIHAQSLKEMGVYTISKESIINSKINYQIYENQSLDNTAYVLFTSGSTGQPKGVMVTAGNINHYCIAILDKLNITEQYNFALVSTLSADLGNTSLFLSLITGGTLHLLNSENRKDPLLFKKYCDNFDINFIKITPSHWKAIFRNDLPNLEYLVFGGESLPTKMVKNIISTNKVKKIYNHYGPTETTIGVALLQIDESSLKNENEQETLPIGYIFGENIAYVKDDKGDYLRRNSIGELLICGPSVSKGYRMDKEKTEEKFVYLNPNNEFESEQVFYKTGDLVRIDEKKCIHFLGRIDRQVKINGYRVELENIEAILKKLTNVRDAAIFYIEHFQKKILVAAIETDELKISIKNIKDEMKKYVPEYMIPGVVINFNEFDVTSNGKKDLNSIQTKVVNYLKEIKSNAINTGDDLESLIEKIFKENIEFIDGVYDRNSNFYDLGGNSLGAIQLIAQLQDLGYFVTALSFFKEPTVNGLVKLINKGSENEEKTHYLNENLEKTILSSAQNEFYSQKLKNPNFYNQSILLDCGDSKVNVDSLYKAINKLLLDNPILTTKFFEKNMAEFPLKSEGKNYCDNLSVTYLNAISDFEIQEHINSISNSLNNSISLEKGDLFKAHLFKCEEKQDFLLIVCHHMVVDLVSWYIICSQINRNYTKIENCDLNENFTQKINFWDWTKHVENNKSKVVEDSWLQHTNIKSKISYNINDPKNTEGNASTVWLGFSKSETKELKNYFLENFKIPLHIAVLSVIVKSLKKNYLKSNEIAIDIESHGRVTFDDSIDISRVIGWHTSTFPIFVDIQESSHTTDIFNELNNKVKEVPFSGIGYGLSNSNAENEYKPVSSICFNFLGNIDFSSKGLLKFNPSFYEYGASRHEENNRGYDIKITGKIIHDCLLLDTSFSNSIEKNKIINILEDVKEYFTSLLQLSTSHASILYEKGTKTGQLNYAPRALMDKLFIEQKRSYESILITGVTGFIGAHVLKEILENTTSNLYCLLRATDEAHSYSKLYSTFLHYFPDFYLSDYIHRLVLLRGDVSENNFGLDEKDYEVISNKVDAIYHFAADTRLIGNEEDFSKTNLKSVENCIDLSLINKIKDIHYMSTLAVSGVNRNNELVAFTELDLDIGQEFQNFYEETKFNSEKLLNKFKDKINIFIYRTGNVSGSTTNAKFQKNACDNRLIQFLIACSKIKKIPKDLGENIVLSQVDVVAKSVVAISLNKICDPDIYHLESPYSISMRRVFEALKENDFEFIEHDYLNFNELFKLYKSTKDKNIALGAFWVKRGGRNVKYRSERTLKLLQLMNLEFTEISDEWLNLFFENLREDILNNIQSSNEKLLSFN